MIYLFSFFNVPATTDIYTYGHTLSLHDALPISGIDVRAGAVVVGLAVVDVAIQRMPGRELALAHANHQDLRGDLRLRGALRRRDQCVAKPEQAAHVPVVLMVGEVGVAAAVI